MVFFCRLTALFALTAGQLVLGQSDYLSNARDAARVLQGWYNNDNGLWDTTGWWNSANCLTVLADLTSIDPEVSLVIGDIWKNTFVKAQQQTVHQAKTSYCTDSGCPQVKRFAKRARTGRAKRGTFFVDGLQIEDVNPEGFLNGFFDDESWWALGWVKVYDITGDREYLTAAENIFEDLRAAATNATCGGVWWDRARTANTAIANELFISVAAHLASRIPAKKDFYLNYAVNNWKWFEQSGIVNAQNQVNDGINLQTCKNNGAEVWSYNQGVILGALVELNKLKPNETYIRQASNIANAAIEHMTDVNGIIHDPREPDNGEDGFQFKGVFARNLKELFKVTKNPAYKTFLENNANTIWGNARDAQSGIITNVWSGPFNSSFASAASHSSGMDALVAAAAVQ